MTNYPRQLQEYEEYSLSKVFGKSVKILFDF